jgi:lipoate-protein ligase A
MHIPGGMDWHLILEPSGHPGARNMAIDGSMLVEADRSGAALLRLYRFTPPCLSFGRNEPARARYDRARIERLGLDVVRRPTGGRAVWHEHELTYAVAAPIAAFGSLRESYHAIHERLVRALRRLGVAATLAPRPSARVDLDRGACFASPSGGEVVVDGKKVIGSAQVRHGTAFLQHGSILLDGSQDLIGAISYQPSANGSTTLSTITGKAIGFQEVAEAIVAGWGAAFTPTAPSRLLPPSSAFSDPRWTWRR